MKAKIHFIIPIAMAAGALNVFAHVSVSGDRTLNSGNAIDNNTFSVNTRTVSSSFGWADATDGNWGDSHRTTAFKFTIASTQNVTITVSRRNAGTGQTGAADFLLPAFSLYQTPLFRASTHDTGPATTTYLTGTFGTGATGETFTDTGSYVAGAWTGTLNGTWDVGESFTDANGNGVYDGPGIGGSGKEGAFQALAPWTIYVDAVDGLPMYFNTLIGHAADGTSANYGNAAGINGDGNADGTVSATFNNLAAGDYYLFAGGANYASQNAEAPIYGPSTNAYPTYGVGVTVSAVPEPGTCALLVLGASSIVLARSLRNRKTS